MGKIQLLIIAYTVVAASCLETEVEVHTLSWEAQNCQVPNDDNVEYFYDGAFIGRGNSGIDTLLKKEYDDNVVVRLKKLKSIKHCGMYIRSPLIDTILFKRWKDKGIIDVHELTWKEQEYKGVKFFEFFFNGTSVGRGSEGISKLKERKIEVGSMVVVKNPKDSKTNTVVDTKLHHIMSGLLKHWVYKGIVVEFKEGMVEKEDELRNCRLLRGKRNPKEIGTGKLHDPESEYKFTLKNEIKLGKSGIFQFSFSSESRILFAVFKDEPWRLHRWNVDRKMKLGSWDYGKNNMIYAMDTSPDGKFLFIGISPKIKTTREIRESNAIIVNTRNNKGKKVPISGWIEDTCFDEKRNAFVAELRGIDKETGGFDSRRIWVEAYRVSGEKVDMEGGSAYCRLTGKTVGCLAKVRSKEYGLFYKDKENKKHKLCRVCRKYNHSVTSEGRLVAVTNRNGELFVWDLHRKKEIYCGRIFKKRSWGRLAYDEKKNRFLIVDTCDEGTTWLRALEI